MPISTGLARLGGRGGAVVRDRHEEHRSSSALEAFFDLCFVVAVAQVSTGLHETLAQHRIGQALVSYVSMFFAVWWAWVNFTWFANAHDADDLPYRLLTLTQMGGALVMALGVVSVFEHQDFKTVTIGYVIMRVAQVTQWIRVARAFESMRARATRYAIGVAGVQALWLLHIPMRGTRATVVASVLVLLEIAVPVWAERKASENLVHLEHITDRYGLFTLIVLGEAVSAATLGVQQALRAGVTTRLLVIAVASLVSCFAAWWLYFGNPHRAGPDTLRGSFHWGYGHFFVFASLGALGAGVHLAAQYLTSTVSDSQVAETSEAATATGAAHVTDAVAPVEHVTARVASLSVALPVSVFILSMVVLACSVGQRRRTRLIPMAGAAVITLVAGLTAPVIATVVIAALTLVVLVGVLTTIDLPAPADGQNTSR